MKKVDLNVDIGEGFPNDEALLEFATSANVCCGEHAGSWELTQETIELCRRKGTRIGAHPGYPDRESMGRRIPSIEEVNEYGPSIGLQLDRFITAHDMAYIKPHGAFYNAMTTSIVDTAQTLGFDAVKGVPMDQLGRAIGVSAAAADQAFGISWRYKKPLMLLPTCSVASILASSNPVIAEGFADRAYTEQGTLRPRSEPGAVLHDPDEIKAQVLRLAPEVDSICIHGDTPNCLEFAEMVYTTLVDHGYEVGY